MPQYVLRDVPSDLWNRVKTRSTQDGWPLRPLFLQLLDDYASGRIRPSTKTPPPVRHLSAREGWFTVHCGAFSELRDQAQRLIDSPAKYLDPALAEGKTGDGNLYTRFGRQLELLERHGLVR